MVREKLADGFAFTEGPVWIEAHNPAIAPDSDEGTDVEVLVKHRTSAGVVGTRMTYATHPFDVVGWDGAVYPVALSIFD